MEFSDTRKPHRKRISGRKASKKKHKIDGLKDAGPSNEATELVPCKTEAKNNAEDEKAAKRRNPKAFTFQSAKRAEKAVRRTADISQKKSHISSRFSTALENGDFDLIID